MYETELPKLLTLSLHLDFQGQKLKLYSCSYFVNIFKSCIKINVTARISEHNSMPAFKMYFWFVLMYSMMMCITCKRSDVQVNLLIWDLRNDCFHKWMKTSIPVTFIVYSNIGSMTSQSHFIYWIKLLKICSSYCLQEMWRR